MQRGSNLKRPGLAPGSEFAKIGDRKRAKKGQARESDKKIINKNDQIFDFRLMCTGRLDFMYAPTEDLAFTTAL